MNNFSSGEQCLLIDRKGKKHLTELREDGQFHSHSGVIPHSEIIGSEPGRRIKTTKGQTYILLRPRLADYILKMRRSAQVVYPKDIGPILVYGDIGPGMTVLEAGTGSGALTMALLRAVGPSGRLISVDLRSDHSEHATKAIRQWFGTIPENLDLRHGEVAEELAEVAPDRVVLDVPEPWDVIPSAAAGMAGGGVFCAYVPTVPQLQQTVEGLRASGCFVEIMAFETMFRTWNIKGRSVRPDHHMVGHTGFLCTARKVEMDVVPEEESNQP